MRHKIALFFIALLFCPPAWAADSAQGEITRATLVAEENGIMPGRALRAGVLLEPKEGWHSYWENPGDAGLATTLEWTLPPGFSAANIDWPPPARIMEGPLATYGYVGDVFLPVSISVPPDATGDVAIKVKASWLICHDICIPESAELDMTLPVVAAPKPSQHAALFEAHRARRPITLPQPITFEATEKQIVLSAPLASLGMTNITGVLFMPRQSNLVRYAAEQNFSLEGGALHLTLERSGDTLPETLSGLLMVEGGGEKKYFDVNLNSSPQRGEAGRGASVESSLDKRPPSAFAKASADAPNLPPLGGGILPLLLAAVLGGMVLNLMPCVLPVLSLKALALVKKSGRERAHVARLGVAYTLGVMGSFAVIAGALIALQQAGEAVGWGYQMQSPAFVGFLIYLLFLVGLNLSGLFHLPVLLGSVGGGIANESSAKGSFFTGILATAVATPCTAPFMAGAVGVALTLPAWQALLVFEALGFGLALPFLVVSLFPRLIRFLPKPGAWMDIFKQFLAFPMYASVIWLLWVLGLQTGAGGMAVALIGMLAIVALIWMKPLYEKEANYRAAALILFALLLALSLPMLERMIKTPLMPEEMHGVATVEFSPEKLAGLRAAGTPVFVDATAAWCITCQVNGRVIHSDPVMKAMRERGVTLMIADWTLRNDAITEFLRGFGYRGVPLYVFYPASGEPVVLPQVLTESMIVDTVSR